jgi:hypothetical protein
MSASELVVKIVNSHPVIKFITLSTYRSLPNLEERLPDDFPRFKKRVLSEAAEIRSKFHTRYWESVFMAFWSTEWKTTSFLVEVLRHDKKMTGEHKFRLSRGDTSIERLELLINRLNPERNLSLWSPVELQGGQVRHIPMMDFRCRPTVANLRKIKKALELVGQRKGVILNSGKSFHFYGLQLLSEDMWRRFLGKCLLLSPITDGRYIGHRLIDGACSLRISPDERKIRGPEVVDIL